MTRSTLLLLNLLWPAVGLLGQAPCGPWTTTPVPFAATWQSGKLDSVSSLSSGEAWAAGYYRVLTNPPYGTEDFGLMLFWNGSAWVQQATPSPGYYPGGARSAFEVVHARTPTDVWASGFAMIATSAGLANHAMVQHFDGTAWSLMPLPAPSPAYEGMRIRTILALASNDVWFGGVLIENTAAGPDKRPLVMHWDGSSMSVLPTPPLTSSGGPFLAGVKSMVALASNDIYACCDVWSSALLFTPTRSIRNVVLHWNGSAWSRLSIPDSAVLHQPMAMEVFAPNDIWVFMNIDPQVAPHALHWNGSTWANVFNVPYAQCSTAFGPADVYSATYRVEHFDGVSWTNSTLFPWSNFAVVSAMAHAGTCGVWAVGSEWVPTSTGGYSPPFAARRQPPPAANVTLRLGCRGPAPNQTLVASGAPVLGQTIVLAIDDPTGANGLVPGQTIGAFGLSIPIGLSGSCGASLAGLGGAAGVGELLLDPGSLVLFLHPSAWTGPLQPLQHALAMPAQPSLAGIVLSTQGALVNLAGPLSGMLTQTLDLTLGF